MKGLTKYLAPQLVQIFPEIQLFTRKYSCTKMTVPSYFWHPTDLSGGNNYGKFVLLSYPNFASGCFCTTHAANTRSCNVELNSSIYISFHTFTIMYIVIKTYYAYIFFPYNQSHYKVSIDILVGGQVASSSKQ